MEWIRNWLLLVSRAAAYFGFIEKARQSVLRISSRLLSVSLGCLSSFIVRISKPSLAMAPFKF
jgi:hypothetical protein